MQTAYLCSISKNIACTKEWCIKHGGPCIGTHERKYAVEDKRGRPVIAEAEETREAMETYLKKRRREHEEAVKT